MKDSPKFYVYFLIDPRNNLPFYVGKGTKNRMYKHDENHSNLFMREKITEIKEAGLKLIYEKVIQSDDDKLCYRIEKFLIASVGRENLCNIHPGGCGAPSGENHPCKDPKVKEKLSQAAKGQRRSPSTEIKPGKRISPETEIKKGQRLSPDTEFKPGFTPWNYEVKGIHLSPKTEFKLGSPAPKTAFKPGHIPWSEGKKCPGIGGRPKGCKWSEAERELHRIRRVLLK